MKRKISVCNVTKRFSTKNLVLNDLTINFYQGSDYAITGASGSGKSTLLHLISLIDVPTSGIITVDDKNSAEFTASEKRYFLNHTIGFLFQQFLFIPELSVIENIMLPGYIAGIDHQEVITRAHELLVAVDLFRYKDASPLNLSGGQQHRAALARALLCKPDFLLADEPTGNLDPQTASDIHTLIFTAQKTWGMGLIISTHDQDLIKKLNTVILIDQGQLSYLKQA